MNLQVLYNTENSGTAQQLLALQYGLCSMELSHIFTSGNKFFESYTVFKKKDIVKLHCLALIPGSDVTDVSEEHAISDLDHTVSTLRKESACPPQRYPPTRLDGIETKNNPGLKISTIICPVFNLKESVFGVSPVTNTPHKLCVDSWWY